MTITVLLLLLLSALAGLVIGRRRAVLPAALAVVPCALLGGLTTGGLALLGTGGLAAGVRLHRVVAEQMHPRVG